MSFPVIPNAEYNSLKTQVEIKKQLERIEINKRKIKEMLKKYLNSKAKNCGYDEKTQRQGKKIFNFLTRKSKKQILNTTELLTLRTQTKTNTQRKNLLNQTTSYSNRNSSKKILRDKLSTSYSCKHPNDNLKQKNRKTIRVKKLLSSKKKFIKLLDPDGPEIISINNEKEEEPCALPKYFDVVPEDLKESQKSPIAEGNGYHINLNGILQSNTYKHQLFSCSEKAKMQFTSMQEKYI